MGDFYESRRYGSATVAPASVGVNDVAAARLLASPTEATGVRSTAWASRAVRVLLLLLLLLALGAFIGWAIPLTVIQFTKDTGAGPRGKMGRMGPTGPDGADGAPGAPGPAGPSGADGAMGSTGATGATGATGTGSTAAGATGSVGPTGATGATGPPFVPSVVWSSVTTYTNGNVVSSNGTLWVALDTNTDSLPSTSNADWSAFGAQGEPGATGATGGVGPTGADGPQGSVGDTGPTGATGAVGDTGPTGPDGDSGAIGNTGLSGATGAPGATGSGGASGPSGAIGGTGNTGATGATSAAAGVTGPTGPLGTPFDFLGAWNATVSYIPGDLVSYTMTQWVALVNNVGVMPGTNASAWNQIGGIGATGPTGPTGPSGATGSIGGTGATGAVGSTGNTGSSGATGATGNTGPTGTAAGPTGPTGGTGASGATGSTGATGANGTVTPIQQTALRTRPGTSVQLACNTTPTTYTVAFGTTTFPDGSIDTITPTNSTTVLLAAGVYWVSLKVDIDESFYSSTMTDFTLTLVVGTNQFTAETTPYTFYQQGTRGYEINTMVTPSIASSLQALVTITCTAAGSVSLRAVTIVETVLSIYRLA